MYMTIHGNVIIGKYFLRTADAWAFQFNESTQRNQQRQQEQQPINPFYSISGAKAKSSTSLGSSWADEFVSSEGPVALTNMTTAEKWSFEYLKDEDLPVLDASSSLLNGSSTSSSPLKTETSPLDQPSTSDQKADQWADEFADMSESQLEQLAEAAVYQQDFWKRLEGEWLADERQQAWVSELEEEPRFEYEFSAENPLRDQHLDPLTEGRRKLAEGSISNYHFVF